MKNMKMWNILLIPCIAFELRLWPQRETGKLISCVLNNEVKNKKEEVSGFLERLPTMVSE